MSNSSIHAQILPFTTQLECYCLACTTVEGKSFPSTTSSETLCIRYLSRFGSLMLYASGSVASSSSSLPYVPSWFLPSVCRLPLVTDSENHKPLLPLLDRRVGVMSRTFLLSSMRTGWIVGRHAQIMPRLTSTLDQIIEGDDSSKQVSVLECYGIGNHTAEVLKAALVLTRKI